MPLTYREAKGHTSPDRPLLETEAVELERRMGLAIARLLEFDREDDDPRDYVRRIVGAFLGFETSAAVGGPELVRRYNEIVLKAIHTDMKPLK